MKKIIITIGIILLISIFVMLFLNFYVIAKTKSNIITEAETQAQAKDINDVDCILILGAGIWGNKPSPMLEDRLNEGYKLYKKGISTKIIVSGDHGTEEYDEVNIMKSFLIEKGVPSEDIFMDHAGFSSYDSVYRAKEIFNVKKMVIVTQKYHLYRSLYIAKCLEIEAYGVGSDPRKYAGQFFREIREILARNKDFLKCIIKPEPKFLGDTIPVSGNGDVTNDKEN